MCAQDTVSQMAAGPRDAVAEAAAPSADEAADVTKGEAVAPAEKPNASSAPRLEALMMEAVAEAAAPSADKAVDVEKGEAVVPAEKPKAAGSAPRLEALDGPRYIASLNIICFHAYGYRGHMEFHLGGLWTQFFFVLAGFVLAYVEMARPAAKAAQQMSTLQYIKKRLITIYPLYAMSLLLYVLVPKKDDMCKWGTLPLHALLLQAIVQVPECGAPYTYWNGVTWFLSALVVYWAMLRPLSRYFRTVSLRACCLWLLGLWLVSLALVPTLQLWHDEKGDNFWLSHGPLGYLHVFVAGVATARIFILTCTKDVATGLAPEADFSKLALATERAPFFLRWGCVAGYGLYAALLATWWHLGATGFMDHEIVWAPADSMERSLYLVLHNGGILPIMVLILAGGAAGVDPIARAFRNPLFQGLAKISYAQYVLQSPVSKMLRQTGMPISTFKICYLPVLIVCAFVAQRLVEKPYADWLRQADAKLSPKATAK